MLINETSRTGRKVKPIGIRLPVYYYCYHCHYHYHYYFTFHVKQRKKLLNVYTDYRKNNKIVHRVSHAVSCIEQLAILGKLFSPPLLY